MTTKQQITEFIYGDCIKTCVKCKENIYSKRDICINCETETEEDDILFDAQRKSYEKYLNYKMKVDSFEYNEVMK